MSEELGIRASPRPFLEGLELAIRFEPTDDNSDLPNPEAWELLNGDGGGAEYEAFVDN